MAYYYLIFFFQKPLFNLIKWSSFHLPVSFDLEVHISTIVFHFHCSAVLSWLYCNWNLPALAMGSCLGHIVAQLHSCSLFLRCCCFGCAPPTLLLTLPVFVFVSYSATSCAALCVWVATGESRFKVQFYEPLTAHYVYVLHARSVCA